MSKLQHKHIFDVYIFPIWMDIEDDANKLVKIQQKFHKQNNISSIRSLDASHQLRELIYHETFKREYSYRGDFEVRTQDSVKIGLNQQFFQSTLNYQFLEHNCFHVRTVRVSYIISEKFWLWLSHIHLYLESGQRALVLSLQHWRSKIDPATIKRTRLWKKIYIKKNQIKLRNRESTV